MTFILSCLFYSFIGCLTGFFAHIFNGLIQKNITFDPSYILKTIGNFIKILAVMILATFVTGLLILIIPSSFLGLIGIDMLFFHQLVFYLFAFAAFDFGLKN
jgi:TctA family transporter